MTAPSLRLWVEAVALCGEGLPDWSAARKVLAGQAPHIAAPVVLTAPDQLSPAERRRAIPSVKLALTVGAAALAEAGLDAADLPAVFASSGADGETINAILTALATPSREVSPTRFHNSVHNAPSGYWGVAMQSRQAVTSLSCYDASFAAGFLEAAAQVVADRRQVLLIAYDLPYPHPLDGVRAITSSFGVALVLSPAPSSRACAELGVRLVDADQGEATSCADPGLERLRLGNPAARALPLLCALAGRAPDAVRLDLHRGAIDIAVTPC